MNLLVAMTVSATSELIEKSGIIQAEKKIKDIVKDGKILQYSGGCLRDLFKQILPSWLSQKIFNDFTMVKELLEKKNSKMVTILT